MPSDTGGNNQSMRSAHLDLTLIVRKEFAMHWTLNPSKAAILALFIGIVSGFMIWFVRPTQHVQLASAQWLGCLLGFSSDGAWLRRRLRSTPRALPWKFVER